MLRITIDGPAGAGKSTVARRLAAALGSTYLDTGAMYRALALKALAAGASTDDPAALERLLTASAIELRGAAVLLDGEDVTERIRRPDVDRIVSRIAAHPDVRRRMVALQQKLAQDRDVVMDGRDTGTDVLPDAEVKIFLTASQAARAKRRYDELCRRGERVDEAEVQHELAERDRRDRDRPVGALRVPPGAVILDSTDLTTDEVVARLLEVVAER